MIQKITYSVVIGRNGQPDSNGHYLVHIEAYQNGHRVYFSTHIHLPRECFVGGLVVNHPLAHKYNAYIYKFRNEIEALELDMIAQGKRCTLPILKAAVSNRACNATTLAAFTESVISSSNRCEHTRSIYRTTIKAVEAFQPGTTLHDIDYDFLVRFNAAQKEKGMSHNTIVCRLRNIRAIINEAVKRHLLNADDNPFLQFRIPSMTPRRGFLDYKDLRHLARLRVDDKEARVRDAFLFCCYTGLRYSDIITLRTEHIQGDWLVKKQEKTGETVKIPFKSLFKGAALEILKRYDSVEDLARIGHNSHANRVLRDLDILKKINEKTKAVVQMTLTTADENLCKIIEPNVCTTSKRFEALKTFRDNGIPTVVWLCPVLPYINDTRENIEAILKMCVEAQVRGVICFGMGLTLRDGNREYFYRQLDKHFPGLKNRYIREYGNRYELPSPRGDELMRLFHQTCEKNGIMHDKDEIFSYLHRFEEKSPHEQLSLWEL